MNAPRKRVRVPVLLIVIMLESSHLQLPALLQSFRSFSCASSRLWSTASVSTAVNQVATVAGAQDKLCSPAEEKKHLPQCRKELLPPQERPGQLNTLVLGEFNIPTAQTSRVSIALVVVLLHGITLAKLPFMSKDSCTGRNIIVHIVTIGPNTIPWPDSTQTLREPPKFFCKRTLADEGSVVALLHGQATLSKQSSSPRQGTGIQTEPSKP